MQKAPTQAPGAFPLGLKLGVLRHFDMRCDKVHRRLKEKESAGIHSKPLKLTSMRKLKTIHQTIQPKARQAFEQAYGWVRHLSVRDQRLAMMALVVFVGWLLVFSFHDSGSTPSSSDLQANLQSIPSTEVIEEVAETVTLATPDPEPSPELEPKPLNWVSVTVEPGQSLDRIFKELNLSAALLLEVVGLDDRTESLVSIRPGDVFHFGLSETGQFQALKTEFDESQWLWVERDEDTSLVSRLEARQMEYRLVEAQATITSSLFAAAKEAKLSDGMTMKLANIFGWDIDFALDIRQGDRFSLLYEEIWRDGEFYKEGPILVARFVNRGDTFEAVRFDAGQGPDYFSPDGRRMRKAFLRAPLNFSRVTSNFNPKRFHPITKKVRPHNGTDYGAARGTPVWSAGDGVVIESAYNRVNGHYVFVQHGNQIVTRYLHLSRRDVERGDRVSQGQTIGTVGSTGLATGAHLHYEFLVNGVHRDPRKVDLPTATPLPEEYRFAFEEHVGQMMTRLDRFDNSTRLLASTRLESCEEQSEAC